jgi:hypothetical protein
VHLGPALVAFFGAVAFLVGLEANRRRASAVVGFPYLDFEFLGSVFC